MSYLMMAADGSVDEQEIVELEQYFASSPKLTGINVRNTLTNIQTKFRPSDMNGVLSIVSVDDLAPDEVFDALVLAFNIAVADGEFSDSERDMLLGIANALNVPEEKTIELIKRLEQVLADSLLEEDE
jgi:tellurite resistance protein